MAPGAGNRTHPVPQLAVAKGVELVREAHRCAAGVGVGHQLTGTLPKCRSIGITFDDRLEHLSQPETGREGRLHYRGKGSGCAELRVPVKQLSPPAGYPIFLAAAELGELCVIERGSRHSVSSFFT